MECRVILVSAMSIRAEHLSCFTLRRADPLRHSREALRGHLVVRVGRRLAAVVDGERDHRAVGALVHVLVQVLDNMIVQLYIQRLLDLPCLTRVNSTERDLVSAKKNQKGPSTTSAWQKRIII